MISYEPDTPTVAPGGGVADEFLETDGSKFLAKNKMPSRYDEKWRVQNESNRRRFAAHGYAHSENRA